jgi:general secretion pathway protein K
MLLASIFEIEGHSFVDSRTLAERIVAWRSLVHSESIDSAATIYLDARRAYTPRHGPFRSVGELRLVMGMTDDLQAFVAPLLTVYTNSPNVDLGMASDRVLQVLAAAGNRFASSQMAARVEGDAAGVDRAPAAGEPLLIEAQTTEGLSMADRFAVVRLQPSREERYDVLAWY